MKRTRPKVKHLPGFIPLRDRPWCRQCGSSLSYCFYRWSDGSKQPSRKGGPLPKVGKAVGIVGYGYRADGLFCSAECGYEYAVDVVESSQRPS